MEVSCFLNRYHEENLEKLRRSNSASYQTHASHRCRFLGSYNAKIIQWNGFTSLFFTFSTQIVIEWVQPEKNHFSLAGNWMPLNSDKCDFLSLIDTSSSFFGSAWERKMKLLFKLSETSPSAVDSLLFTFVLKGTLYFGTGDQLNKNKWINSWINKKLLLSQHGWIGPLGIESLWTSIHQSLPIVNRSTLSDLPIT